MTTILINPDSLQAIALAASKEQSRYYLNGVNVELYKDGSYGLIATDGHRLHTLQTKANEALDSSYILSNDDIKKAVSLAKMARKEIGRGLQQLINIQIDAAFNIKIVCAGKEFGAFTATPVDGTFPDWRRVIPSSTEGGSPVMAFDADYMADFGEACRLLNGTKTSCIEMTSTGKNNPMIIKVAGCPDFLGVLMPMRF